MLRIDEVTLSRESRTTHYKQVTRKVEPNPILILNPVVVVVVVVVVQPSNNRSQVMRPDAFLWSRNCMFPKIESFARLRVD